MFHFLRDAFDPLFDLLGAMLSTFHGWGAPWWLAIVMLTLVVRTLLAPLTVRQVKSMRKMQELKPDMDEIREKYKGDPGKQQEEQMKLYGERGVNPLGGCLPLFIQLPIFIVLYQTIKQFEHLESFRTGGLSWFQDLTVADPFFILPVAYVLTMMASQELTIRRTAPQQKNIMRIMPIAFGIFLFRFPAALFVYWVTSNLITFCQNLVIYRTSPKPAKPESVDTSKAGAPDTDAKAILKEAVSSDRNRPEKPAAAPGGRKRNPKKSTKKK